MKTYLFLLLSLGTVLFSCTMRKVTEVSIRNDNDDPVRIIMMTNNIKDTFPVLAPHAGWTGQYDWTGIEPKDGQWIVFVTNTRTGVTDSFAHGYYAQGELAGYAELICMGRELKIKISE